LPHAAALASACRLTRTHWKYRFPIDKYHDRGRVCVFSDLADEAFSCSMAAIGQFRNNAAPTSPLHLSPDLGSGI